MKKPRSDDDGVGMFEESTFGVGSIGHWVEYDGDPPPPKKHPIGFAPPQKPKRRRRRRERPEHPQG